MYDQERVTLSRESAAIQIPSGTWITVPAGSAGVILQSLGGTYTVALDNGNLVRIEGKHGDALGKEPLSTLPEPEAAKAETSEEVEELVWDQLRTVYDPEIPINLADLGLVYGCAVTPAQEGSGHRVEIKMTLTAPACGMGDVLKAEVESKVSQIPGVSETDVELVFEPPWDYNMIPDAAKLTLGMM